MKQIQTKTKYRDEMAKQTTINHKFHSTLDYEATPVLQVSNTSETYHL